MDKTRRKYIPALSVTALLLMFLLSGCNAIVETFGKEYRMIDSFFEQLEADIRYSFEKATASENLTAEQINELETQWELFFANLKIDKELMKTLVKGLGETLKELEYTGSASDYVERELLNIRAECETTFKELTGGRFTLEKTEVDRGFLGSIWHWIRNNWIIALIIIGVIGAIWDKVGDKLEDAWLAFREKRENKGKAMPENVTIFPETSSSEKENGDKP
jgi:hypothetical protein